MRHDPWRARSIHKVVLEGKFTPFVAGAFTTDYSETVTADNYCRSVYYLNRIYDSDGRQNTQNLATNIPRMASRYQNVRVTGATVTMKMTGATRQDYRDHYTIICYRVPSKEQNTVDDPLAFKITDAQDVNNILARKDVVAKKEFFTNGFGGGNAITIHSNTWRIGYIDMTKLEMQRMRDMDDNDFSCGVSWMPEFPAPGFGGPVRHLGIRFRALSMLPGGFDATSPQLTYKLHITYHAEWYNRRIMNNWNVVRASGEEDDLEAALPTTIDSPGDTGIAEPDEDLEPPLTPP